MSALRVAQGVFTLIALAGAVPLCVYTLPESWHWFALYLVAAGTWNAGRLDERCNARPK